MNLLSEKNLRNFNHILNESGIRINEGTKSAKIVTHKDLDGLVSAVLIKYQLIKQGIPENRITVEFAQYGDKEEDIQKSATPKNKSQLVAVTDFAKLPYYKVYDGFKKLTGFKTNDNDIIKFVNSVKARKMSKKDFSAKLYEYFNVVDNKFTQGTINTLYEGLKKFGDENISIEDLQKLNKIQTVSPDLVTDHHSNDQGSLYGGKTGKIAVEAPSEAYHTSRTIAPGIMTSEDIHAVSVIDSAGYNMKDLENTLYLEKKWKGSGDIRKNVAIILAALYDNLVKKDEEAARYVVLNSKPSLISMYNTTINALKLNKMEIELFDALKANNNNKAIEISKQLPKRMGLRNYSRVSSDEIKKANDIEAWQKKNVSDIEKNKTGYLTRKDNERIEELKSIKKNSKKNSEEWKKANEEQKNLENKKGHFTDYKSFMMQNAENIKDYPSRYMGALLSKNGERKPFTVKRFKNFIQLAKNPLYKGEIDFPKIFDEHVKGELENYLTNNLKLNKYKVSSIMEKINQESGGHKAIFSASGLDDKSFMTSAEKNDYYNSKQMVEKIKKFGNNPEEKIPKTFAKYTEMEKIHENSKETLNKVLDFIEGRMIYWANKQFEENPGNTEGLKADEKWNIKND